jgi:hypothetical protein
MKQVHTSLNLIAGATIVAAFAVAGTPASAQEPSASTAAAPTAPVKRPPQATATPDMILEAIQRSQARTEKLNTTGKAEQFGSEEPFTFDPKK